MDKDIAPVIAVMSLAGVGVFVCVLYLCLHAQEDVDESPPRVNHIQTVASAPEEEWLQFSPTNVGQNFRHLFTNNTNNQASNRDIAFNIDDIYIPGLGLRNYHDLHASDNDYGFVHPLNDDNGFNHPLARHHTLNISSLNKPLLKIETPPPSYFEATKDLYNLNYSHRPNQRDNDRGLCSCRGLAATTYNNNESRSFDRNCIAEAAKRRVGYGYEQSDTNIEGNNTYHTGGNSRGIAGNSRGSMLSAASPAPSFSRCVAFSDRGVNGTGANYSGGRSDAGNDARYNPNKHITESGTRYMKDRYGAGVGCSDGRSDVGNGSRFRDSIDVSESGTGYNNYRGATGSSVGHSGERSSNENESRNIDSRGTNITPCDGSGNGRCDSGIRDECNCGSTDHIEINF